MGPYAAAAMLLAVGTRLLYGPGVLGYDALWGLRWGHEMLTGHVPAFTAPVAPTPHPLVNLVSAVLMILGTDAATTVLLALSWLSFGALAVIVARFAAGLFGWPAGVFAGLAILTRGFFVAETGQAFVDLPFLALAVWALDRERRSPRGLGVPLALMLAGLLRPEGWALEAAYLAYRWRDLDPRGRMRLAGLLAAAPLLWAGMDLWATGDPLHSLHGTQALGEALDRPRSTGTAIKLAPAALRDTIQPPLIWVALAGGLAGLLFREREIALPGAVVVLGLAGYLVLGVAGLPLLNRYLLLPSAMLIAIAGLAVFGWTTATEHRWAWRAFGLIAALVVLSGARKDLDTLRYVRGFTAGRHQTQDALREAARATQDVPCATALAPDRRSQATVTAQRLGSERPAGAQGTLVFDYADATVALDYALNEAGRARLPRASRRVRADPFWKVGAAGC